MQIPVALQPTQTRAGLRRLNRPRYSPGRNTKNPHTKLNEPLQRKRQHFVVCVQCQTPGLIAPPSLWGWPLHHHDEPPIPELLPKSLDELILGHLVKLRCSQQIVLFPPLFSNKKVNLEYQVDWDETVVA